MALHELVGQRVLQYIDIIASGLLQTERSTF